MPVSTAQATDQDEIRAALGDARSVLFLSPGDGTEEETCAALMSRQPPEDAKLLCVTLDETPDERLEVWRTHVGRLPDETGVIAVGETTRSAAAAAPAGPGPAPVSIDTVADPSDLTGLAMAIGAYLDAWSTSTETPVVCFHSITSLLFHADRTRIFRFLHATTGRLRDLGAVSHFHLDPSTYDDGTVNAFSALFDAVVRVEDGSVTVSTRR